MIFSKKKFNDKSQKRQITDLIVERLKQVKVKEAGRDIVALGLVSPIIIHDGVAFFTLNVRSSDARDFEPIRASAADSAGKVKGIKRAVVTLTSEVEAETRSSGAKHTEPQIGVEPPKRKDPGLGVGGINSIIAVASGKGGVGKSTAAVNVAVALHQNGLKVGLLDGDIYGPSLPKLLGTNKRPAATKNKAIIPLEIYGLKVMSLGFMIDPETPVIWRGPMIISAFKKMLNEVIWDKLDVLVVDMPPGTGDIPLTLSKNVVLSGALIVSTPQDLALIDARKAINMFSRVDVPILGIIENMSYYICPNCGQTSKPFDHGGARLEAEKLKVEFLGAVPLDASIRLRSDRGQPIVASEPNSRASAIYREIAARIAMACGVESA